MKLEELQIILQILIVLLGLYLAFFKSYFQEKGKNLATKEDVEEITSKVEKIRHDLHLETESKLSLRIEERNALVDYYTKYHYWLNTILEAAPSDVDEKNEVGFKEIEARLYKAKFDFDIAKAKFDIFVKNVDILNLEVKTILGALELQHTVQKVMLELTRLHFNISVMRKTAELSLQLEKYQELLDEKADIVRKFNERKLEKYKEVVVDSRALRDLVYNQIKSLAG